MVAHLILQNPIYLVKKKEEPSDQSPDSSKPTNFEKFVNELNQILNAFTTDPKKAQQDMEDLHKKLQQEIDKVKEDI